MSKEAKKYYEDLKKNKELKEVFPKATGEWDTDKESFVKLYNENIKFVLDFEKGLGLDDDLEDEFIHDDFY